MQNIGDRVKVVSIDKGMSSKFFNRCGTVVKSNPKEYYKYLVEFDDMVLDEEARYLWWAEENLAPLEDGEEDIARVKKELMCTRCESPMVYLKEYRFDSQDSKRGITETFFDIEEHLIFKIFVCPKCRHAELFYTGRAEGMDDWVDLWQAAEVNIACIKTMHGKRVRSSSRAWFFMCRVI